MPQLTEVERGTRSLRSAFLAAWREIYNRTQARRVRYGALSTMAIESFVLYEFLIPASTTLTSRFATPSFCMPNVVRRVGAMPCARPRDRTGQPQGLPLPFRFPKLAHHARARTFEVAHEQAALVNFFAA